MNVNVLYDMSYGVYFASTLDGDKKVGCVANTAFQITASPVRIGVSVNKNNYTEDCIRKSGYFTLTVASEETPMEVIGKFGFYSARDIDKFENVSFKTAGDGYPVVDEKCCSYLLCKVEAEIDCDTHTIFIGEAVEGEKLTDCVPMTYAYYHKVKGGTTAKNAPTYIEDKAEAEEKPYVCEICGYTFPGSSEEFEALGDDWVCPICRVPKTNFKQK